VADAVERYVPGLSEARFGLRYYFPEFKTLFEIEDLRRKSGELWGEVTVRCKLEGVKGQLDGDRLRQGNFNFSSLRSRQDWARALGVMVPAELNTKVEWGNVMESVCQAVLVHQRQGAVHGRELEGKRIGAGGRPWAAWPILPDHEMATLFARGGAGKTGLVATIAYGMAMGKSLIPGIRVDRPYRVVILDWETNAETADDLWGLISETYQVPVPRGVWYEPMEQPIERSLPKIANLLDQHRADCVIVDSVTMSLLSSSEFSDPAEGITRAYQQLRRIGAWGLLIDHVTGGDLRSRKVAMKAYGSIFKLNLARHAVALHIGNRFGDTSQAYLACPKSNVGRDRWAMAGTLVRNDNEIRWAFGEPDFELYDTLTRETDENSDIPEERLATPRQADLYLEALDEMPDGMTVAQIASMVNASSDAFVRKTLNKLQRDGLVSALKTPGVLEKRWVLSTTGAGFLANRRDGVG
jgi:hypothetical protein